MVNECVAREPVVCARLVVGRERLHFLLADGGGSV